MLGRGELRCIGATTLDEYRKHIEKDPALERRFQQVLVEQPSVQDTVSILRGLRERYELHHGVSSRTAPWSKRRCSRTATLPTASCQTRPSTSWTSRRQSSKWTPLRSRRPSTSWTGRS